MTYRLLLALLLASVVSVPAWNQDPLPDRVVLVLATGEDSNRVGRRVSGPNLSMNFERLYQWVPTEAGAVMKPWIASDWPQISDNGLRHRISLRKEATFGAWDAFPDNKPRRIDVDDVIFSIKWLIHRSVPKSGSKATRWHTHHFDTLLRGRIEGLDAFAELAVSKKDWDYDLRSAEISGLNRVDQYTLEVRLTRPCGYLPMILAHPSLAILPFELAVDDRDEYSPFAGLASSGPMTYRRVDGEKTLLPEVRKDYWGDLPPHDPVFMMEGVLEYLPEYLQAAAGSSGRAVYADVQLADLAQARKVWDGKPQFHMGDAEQLHFLAFNMERPLFGGEVGRKLRHAISDFLPRQALCDESAATEPWRVSRSLLLPVNGVQSPKTAELPAVQDKVTARAAVLAAAPGVEPDAKGCVLDLTIAVAQSSFTVKMRDALGRSLGEIGIRANIKVVSDSKIEQAMSAGEFDAIVSGWANDWPDPLSLLTMLHSRNAGNSWPFTLGCRYRNETFDALLEKAEAAAVDPAAARSRQKLIDELLTHCTTDLPFAPLAVPQRAWVATEKLEVPAVPQSAGITYRFLRLKAEQKD